MNLVDEMLRAANALESAGVSYALVGGLACSLYVEPRATEDIDFLLAPVDWEKAAGALQPLGWLELAQPMRFKSVTINRLTKISGEAVLVMDFLMAEPEFESELKNAIIFQIEGQNVRVAEPQTIIRLKSSRMSGKDQIDIAGLEKMISENKQ